MGIVLNMVWLWLLMKWNFFMFFIMGLVSGMFMILFFVWLVLKMVNLWSNFWLVCILMGIRCIKMFLLIKFGVESFLD